MRREALILMGLIMLNLTVSGCAKTVSERGEASPTILERITKEKVTGRVTDVGPTFLSIRENYADKGTYGEMRLVRVDGQTKMDQVALGDEVKAYVGDDGYASTIQHVTSEVPASTGGLGGGFDRSGPLQSPYP